MAELGSNPIAQLWNFGRSLFGLFFGGIPNRIRRALDGLRMAVIGVAQESRNFARESNSFLSRLLGGLGRFWTSGLLPLIKWLRAKFIALTSWLKRTFRPIYEFLDKLRKWLDWFDRKILRPIMDIIDATRFFLRTMSLLGVKWAKSAEQKLSKLQSWISSIDLRVRKELNQIRNAVDRIVTGDYLLQRFALLRSLERDAPYWIRAWWNKQITSAATNPIPPTKEKPYLRRPVQEEIETLREYARTGGGPLAPKVEEYLSITLAMMSGAEE